MRKFLSEKNIVIVLFVLVLITFSLAQEDSKKMERLYTGANSTTTKTFLVQQRPAEIAPSSSSPIIIAE